jgi:tetratricopeptide (TPR) repeat protein
MREFAAKSGKAVPLNPRIRVLDGIIFAEQGDAAYDAKEHPKALRFYEQALEVADYPVFHVERAKALLELDRDQDALLELSKALSERPFLKWARSRRAYLYASRGHLKEAAEDYERLHQRYPQDAEYEERLRYVKAQGEGKR